MSKTFSYWLAVMIIAVAACADGPVEKAAENNSTSGTSVKREVPRIEPTELVSKVEGLQSFRKAFGTGFCLNAGCDWVVTNYHVIKATGEHPSVRGVKTDQISFATSETDKDAEKIHTGAGDYKYTWIRDVALLKMREPLVNKGMHAVPFFTGTLETGQTATVVGYPGGKLVSVQGKFVVEYDDGRLRFDLAEEVSFGISGGLVLDAQGRAIGLVCGIPLENSKSIYAVPVWAVADLVKGASPEVYAGVFGEAEKASDDGGDGVERARPTTPGPDPQLVLPESYIQTTDAFAMPVRRYTDESAVKGLRERAQTMAEEMKNFVARQTIHFSGGGQWQHELQVVDGTLKFRTAGKTKELLELPSSSKGPVPGPYWSELVENIAFDPNFALHFEGDMTVNGKTLRAFSYQERPEDDICSLRVRGSFGHEWRGNLACRGTVLTDDQFRILLVTRDMLMIPRGTGLAHFSLAVLYGYWGDRLVPAEMMIRSQQTTGVSQASKVVFDHYRGFESESRIVFGQ